MKRRKTAKIGAKAAYGKISKKGEKILKEVWDDPLTQEYVRKQKKLAEEAIKKAIHRIEQNIKL